MLQRVFSGAGIEGVAVGQEGLAPQLLHQIRHRLGIVGPQKGQIAQLSKVHFDGGKFILEVDLTDAGPAEQFLQFLRDGHPAGVGAEIAEINFACHKQTSCVLRRCPADPAAEAASRCIFIIIASASGNDKAGTANGPSLPPPADESKHRRVDLFHTPVVPQGKRITSPPG